MTDISLKKIATLTSYINSVNSLSMWPEDRSLTIDQVTECIGNVAVLHNIGFDQTLNELMKEYEIDWNKAGGTAFIITDEKSPVVNDIVLAIVGGRGYTNYDRFKEITDDYIGEVGNPTEIVSGGAKGVDSMAEIYAKDNNIPIKVFKPDWSKHGEGAGTSRNTDIIEYGHMY